MIDTKQLEKHLALAKRIVKDTKILTKEYNGQTPQQVVELLSAAIECNIPPEEMYVDGWHMIKLKHHYCSFCFDVVHNYRLTNKTTHQTLNDSKWYIHFGCGGCGRLNLCASSDYAYKAEADILVFAEFGTQRILSNSMDRSNLIQMKFFPPIKYEDIKDKNTTEIASIAHEMVSKEVELMKEKYISYFASKKHKHKPVHGFKVD